MGRRGVWDRSYCHYTGRTEAESLIRLDLELEDSFEDDGPEGNLNLYLALRRSGD